MAAFTKLFGEKALNLNEGLAFQPMANTIPMQLSEGKTIKDIAGNLQELRGLTASDPKSLSHSTSTNLLTGITRIYDSALPTQQEIPFTDLNEIKALEDQYSAQVIQNQLLSNQMIAVSAKWNDVKDLSDEIPFQREMREAV
jgi:hypothetical protein